MAKRNKAKYDLHDAAEQGDVDTVKALIKKRWPVNELDERHWTALHCAAAARQLDCVRVLLKSGANPRAVTSNNATALHFVARCADAPLLNKVLALLTEKGADVNARNYQQNTPLHEACLRSSIPSVRFLLSKGADINAANHLGETPLHNAVRSGDSSLVSVLMEAGAAPDIAGKNGTPAHVADRELPRDVCAEVVRRLASDRPPNSPPVGTAGDAFDYASMSAEERQVLVEAGVMEVDVNKHFEVVRDILRFTHKSLKIPEKKLPPLFLDEDPKQLYKLGELEGEGGYGSVKVAVDMATKNKVAIKIQDHVTAKDISRNENEIRTLMECQHKNVVTFKSAYIVDDKCWIAMEFLRGGNLKKAISSTPLEMTEVAYIIREITQGLALLHSRHIIHRDIKCSNVALSVDGDVKLVDFGLSYNLARGGKLSIAGSPAYIAPEVIAKEPHTTAIDIWSLGITIIEMIQKHPPFNDNSLQAMTTAVLCDDYEAVYLTSEKWAENIMLKHLVLQCLQRDPLKRPTAAHLLKHKFLHHACSRVVIQDTMSRLFLKSDLNSMGFGLM